MVEAIDPRAGVVIASSAFPHYLLKFVNDSTAYSYRVDASEIPYIDIWRVRLENTIERRR
jgi:hypothetical protein